MNLNENLDKLPKWAQQEVKVLQMRLNEAKEEIDRIKSNPVSNTFSGHETTLRDYPKPFYLKDNENITFRLSKGNVSVRIENDHVSVSSHGEGELMLHPNVSNVFSIYLI